MISHLDRFNDWTPLARAARYRSRELARLCLVNLRQLERYFAQRFGKSPHVWLDQQRMLEAAELLLKGDYVKAVASDLHFKNAAHFCRNFKRRYGLSPLAFVAQRTRNVAFRQSMSHSDNPIQSRRTGERGYCVFGKGWED